MSTQQPPSKSEVDACRAGFQSSESADILRSLAQLPGLVLRSGVAAASSAASRLRKLHSLASVEAADSREALVGVIHRQPGAEELCLRSLEVLVDHAAPQARASAHGPQASAELGSQTPASVVLNCANIGCSYGEHVLGRTTEKFVWEGVLAAYNFYVRAGMVVHAIVGERLLNRTAGDLKGEGLRSSLVVIPSRDEMRDNDDLSTLQEAEKYHCQFVDNDNYRDWFVRLKDRPRLRQWFERYKGALHVAYYFDRFNKFTPLKEPSVRLDGGVLALEDRGVTRQGPGKCFERVRERSRSPRRCHTVSKAPTSFCESGGTLQNQPNNIAAALEAWGAKGGNSKECETVATGVTTPMDVRLHPERPPARLHVAPLERPVTVEAPLGGSTSVVNAKQQDDMLLQQGDSVSHYGAIPCGSVIAEQAREGVNRLELPLALMGATLWEAVAEQAVHQAPKDGDKAPRPLRTLRLGERFQVLARRPAEGQPEWLALKPRGWVRVMAAGQPAVMPCRQ